MKGFLWSLCTGLLLSMAWPVSGYFPLVFIAWIPLLKAEADLNSPNKTQPVFYMYAFAAMLVWNILTTWWIKNASFGGAILAITANSLLMAMILYLFHFVKVKKGPVTGYIAFIAFWISFEYIHLQWDITWPWLTLGNVFAGHIEIIQWYEFTGVFGGSLWVLGLNLFIFLLIQHWQERILRKKLSILISVLIVFPIMLSLAIYKSYEEVHNPMQVVIVQPNIDPYTEKFDNMTSAEQLHKMFALTQGFINSTTDYLICPETAIVDYIVEDRPEESEDLKIIDSLLHQHKRLNILIGASTLKFFKPNEPLSVTARSYGNGNEYYDSYNTALQTDTSGQLQFYHKSKLVPGVEKMPWPGVFKYFERFAIDLGGISGSLGMQKDRVAFFTANKKFAAAPIICYESVYGSYVGDYVKKGANFLAIITNDGWWGDTPGYKQHLKYGAIRAIETRRCIVRSANTGISAIINQKGEIKQFTAWWEEAVITGTINVNNKITFYTRFGDYIPLFTSIISIVLLFSLFLKSYTKLKTPF